MAQQITIAIRSDNYTKAWLDRIILLNEEYNIIIRDIGTSLTEMRNWAEGILIERIVELGSADIAVGQQISEAMSSVWNDVLKTIEITDSFSQEIVDLIRRSKNVLT